jgi:hypothetical protein
MRLAARLLLGLSPSAIVAACGLSAGGLLDEGAGDAGAPSLESDGSFADAPAEAIAVTPPDATADAGADADGQTPADAAPVDAPIDVGPCDGVVCNGACLDASTCVSCDGSPLLCASSGACGASCDSCEGRPIQCFNCDSNRQNPVGTCELDDAGAYCLAKNNYPGYHCACANKNNPNECPGTTQTCAQLDIFTVACLTCGEPGTDGLACRGGGACAEADASCH